MPILLQIQNQVAEPTQIHDFGCVVLDRKRAVDDHKTTTIGPETHSRFCCLKLCGAALRYVALYCAALHTLMLC